MWIFPVDDLQIIRIGYYFCGFSINHKIERIKLQIGLAGGRNRKMSGKLFKKIIGWFYTM
jgi:hypothetical protein